MLIPELNRSEPITTHRSRTLNYSTWLAFANTKQVGDLLRKLTPEIVAAAEGFAKELIFIPVSANGSKPRGRSGHRLFRDSTAGYGAVLGRSSMLYALSNGHRGSLEANSQIYPSRVKRPTDPHRILRRFWDESRTLYTSAPQGLKQGSRGFCTVLSTVGMPQSILAQRLENLSGYRNVIHHKIQSRKRTSLLQQRPFIGWRQNTIHLVADRLVRQSTTVSERTKSHITLSWMPKRPPPPDRLRRSRSQLHAKRLDVRPVQTTPVGPNLPAYDRPTAICHQWAGITGDAGWGGFVASHFMQPASKSLWIIFSEEHSPSMLALMEEAIALRHPRKRWSATFSTYFTNLPPDVVLQIRCVLAGTETRPD